MPKALVTGGAGYIGAVAAAMLLEAGWGVRVLDDLSEASEGSVPQGVELARGSVAEAASGAMEGVDAVLHFAGKSRVAESMDQPGNYWRANFGGTLSVVKAMREHGVRKIVLSSSAAVYGEPEPAAEEGGEQRLDEKRAVFPSSVYGMTKAAAENVLSLAALLDGFAAMSLRYFNVAGAWKSSSGVWFGERHSPETHLLPLALKAAAAGTPLKVWGSDYGTPDGTAVRDYIHVADVARAHVLALEHLQAGKHEVANLGTGRGHSVLEVAQAASEAVGLPLALDYGPRRPGDPASLVAAPGKARRVLAWQAALGLPQMAADAWAFLQSQGALQG